MPNKPQQISQNKAAFSLVILLFFITQIHAQDISISTYSGQSEITTPVGNIFVNDGFTVPYGQSIRIHIGGGAPANTSFSYTVGANQSKVSIGIFDQNDNLVRTLASNQPKQPGTYDTSWDGRLDNLTYANDGTYTVKILKSNVQESWLGTYFNNSDSISGSTKWHGDILSGIQFMGNKGFATPAYLEGNYQLFTFDTAHPNVKTSHGGLLNQTTMTSCTDGNIVYTYALAAYGADNDPNNANIGIIYGFNANGNEVTFSSGQGYGQHSNVFGIKYSHNINGAPYQPDTAFYSGSPTHIYAGYLEAEVDYSNPDIQRAWTLKHNYGARISPDVESFEQFHKVYTLSNGRTYATIRTRGVLQQNIVELSDTGVRYTPAALTFQGDFGREGDIWETNTGGNGTGIALQKTPLTGFDGNNNPIYSSAYPYITYPEYQDSLPFIGAKSTRLANGDYIGWNNGINAGMHLGVTRQGQNYFRALGAHSTWVGYQGDYPTDNTYEIGNGVNNSGGVALALDSFVWWNAHLEFYKASGQGNEWQMHDKDLLPIGTWGITQSVGRDPGECAPWNAGNAVRASVVKVNGSYYVLHCDESRHGGIHVERVDNLNTLSYDYAVITKNGTPAPVAYPFVRLLDGLPRYNSASINGVAGWTADANNDSYYTYTDFGTYNPFLPPDLYAVAYNADKNVSRTLPGNGSDWELSGSMGFPGQIANGMFTPSNRLYLKIYDNANKVIATLQIANDGWGSYGAPHNFMINDALVYHDVTLGAFTHFNSFDLKTVNGQLQFTFMGNTVTTAIGDATANILQPAKFSIEFVSGDPYSGNAQRVDIKDLNFWNH